MRCNKCHLHQCSMSQVMPKGSLTPDIYFIIDCPEEEDLRFGQILTGARGRYLESFLTSLNISNYRMWSLVRCTPYATAYTQEALGDTYHVPQTSTIRQPDDMEILACEDYIKMDIQKTQPKLIVPLGGVPLKWLMSDEYNKITKHRGKLYDATINGVTYKVLPTYSPSYVIHNRDNIDITKEFFEDLRKAGQVADGTWVDVMTENKMTFALTYNDFKSYYVSQLMSEPELAYDIETNAELVYHKDFDIIGWSLAKKRNGIYVCCKSLDYEMSDSEAELCKQLLVSILKNTPKITVHNSLYERPATLYNLGYDMPFDKVDDTLVMAKLMLGGKTGAGLKPNAQKIGYPAWDEDLDDYIDLFKTFLARLKLAKFRPIVASMRDGVSLTDIVNQLLQEDTQSRSTTNQEKFAEIIEYVNDLQKLLLKYYESDEMGHLMDLYTQKVLYGFDNGIPGTIPYNWIPYKMLCRYGATDSLATVDLKDHYIQRFKDESTESVNLAEGYKYALMEHYAGYAMTMAGLAWDDDAAERDFQKFNRICINSLKYILKHPVVEKYVIDHCYDDYVPDVVYDNYNDYFWDTFKRRCICTGQDANGYNMYRLEYEDNNGRVKKKHIKHLMVDIEDKLPPTIKADIESRIAETIRKEIAETDDVDTLKSFFNPASTVSDVFDLASAVLVTPELKFCHFLRLVRDIVHDGEFDINNFTSPDREFLEMFVKYLEIPADKPEDRKQPFMEIEQYVSQVVRFNDDQLKNAYGDSVNLMLEGLDDTSQIMIFDDLCVGPINPDDPTTWTDLFKWLVNLRSYKKSVKIISAYIEGKVGRSSVYVVPHKELSNGDDVVPRLRTYDECEIVNGKAKISADEAFLEQTSFGVGTAETGRWRSAYHVIPTGSSVKKLYTSRFKGGTILQPDFSANELRCVASAAQEENMLQAFREGKDIHRANAAKIYNVPEDQVTTFQRRFAKTLSFMTLYGGGAYSMADEYFGGDVQKAQKQLDDFFTAFPGLKSWIDERHKEVMETGKVSVLTQRFLNIDFDHNDKRAVSQAMRAAQNYPIQSASSTMAAVIFSDIIRYMRDNNMKTKPVLFIHDSIESDVYPYELLSIIKYEQVKLAHGAVDYFGIECKADVSMGYSLGHECEMTKLEILDDECTKAYITLEGWQDEIFDTMNNWKLAYHKVETVEEEWKEVYTPMSQMFIPRKAFDTTVLSNRCKGSIKIYIQYYNDAGEIEPMANSKSDVTIHSVWDNCPLIGLLGN